MSDDYRTRMLAIAEELRAQGVNPYTSAPPIYRLAWLMGLFVRPPFYQRFSTIALGFGAFFAIGQGLFFFLFSSFGPLRPLPNAVILFMSLFAGTFFGLTMAGYYRRKSRSLRLPRLPEIIVR